MPLSGLAFRLAVFVAGACLSYKYVAGYWVVGPVFGGVVLLWYVRSAKELLSARAAAYFAASTLIWALVFWMAGQKNLSGGQIFVPVAAGSVLLPLAHALFLGASRRRAFIAMPVIYGVFLAMNALAESLHLDDRGLLVQYSLNVVAAWQAAYLACLFFKKGNA